MDNMWNNFVKEQTTKLKESEVAHTCKLSDLWKAMSMEEKEKYRLKREINVGPRTSIQCSVSEFVKKWKGLGEERCTNLKNNLKDNPFKSLLEMDGGVRNTELILDLVSNFDITKKSLHINGRDYIVTLEDFTSIMGIEDGREEINLKHKIPEKKVTQLNELFLDEKADQHQVCNKKVLKHLKNDDINIANQAYALFSLIHIVCAPSRGILNGGYLSNIDDMKNKKWATLAINELVKGINSFKNSKGETQIRLGGCVLFLQLFYMSKAGMTPPPKDVQLLKYVKKDTVDKFLKKRETEREYAESSERGVEHLEKKQKVIHEEVIANSLSLKYKELSLKYKELDEELKFCEKLYPRNETCKEIKNKIQIFSVAMNKKAPEENITNTAEILLSLKNLETQN